MTDQERAALEAGLKRIHDFESFRDFLDGWGIHNYTITLKASKAYHKIKVGLVTKEKSNFLRDPKVKTRKTTTFEFDIEDFNLNKHFQMLALYLVEAQK